MAGPNRLRDRGGCASTVSVCAHRNLGDTLTAGDTLPCPLNVSRFREPRCASRDQQRTSWLAVWAKMRYPLRSLIAAGSGGSRNPARQRWGLRQPGGPCLPQTRGSLGSLEAVQLSSRRRPPGQGALGRWRARWPVYSRALPRQALRGEARKYLISPASQQSARIAESTRDVSALNEM